MTQHGHRRNAFTLVELLIVMLIVGILASLTAAAVAHALESAKICKTRGLIACLNSLVMQRWESYRFRRIPIEMPPTVMRPTDRRVIPTPPAVAAQVRCDALRQLTRMEMPERWTDITDGAPVVKLWYDPINSIPYLNPNSPNYPATITLPSTSALQSYATYYQTAATASGFAASGAKFQSAKCLYLVVTMGLDDPDVLENFSADEIADVDGSGCKCFIDAWGHPIGFLRWAPGYVSPLQPNPPTDADQTDPTQFYGAPNPTVAGMPRTFALYPLIYSAGPDGYYDLVEEADTPQVLHYGNQNGQGNPFYSLGGASVYFSDGPIGTPAVLPLSDRQTGRALGNADNIDNHSLGRR